jgi:two-component system phosphate regulon response regulator PhoB
MKGRVTVQAEVTNPVSPVEPSTEPKKYVLVVEDEQGMQNLVRIMLGRIGMETHQCFNVEAAVQVLRTQPLPELVLLDMMLPDVSGLELLRQMRAKDFFDTVPIVMLSAIADPEKIREALSLGADRYVIKTAISHSLIRTVQDVLKTGRRKTA